MTHHIDSQLQELKDLMLSMGGAVERAIEESCQAVIRREPARFQTVYALEKKINELHISVDQACFNLLARQAPVAKDLRLVLAIVKINTDLERMGDHTVNISHSCEDYLTRTAVNINSEIQQMATEVRSMVRDSLDAFVAKDVEKSKKLLERDDIVDQFKAKLKHHLLSLMRSDASLLESCLDLISIIRNLERLADHATNIAEEVVFLATGDDIRHGHSGTGT